MALKKLQHASHECLLTSSDIVENGICNICSKDEPVEFSCITCNFDLCKACSKLPHKVSHEFHSEHPLEFCLRKHDQRPEHILCSCCGCLSSESFYKCKECEIYLDLSCAILPNIFRSWDDNKKLHYSHAHLLQRCRPGPDARGSCLLCELPLSPSAICYGCVHCYSFIHERCLDFSMEIQHPVHPAHPLRRLDYTQNCGPVLCCKGCGNTIATVPIGCPECRFYLHLRCADSSLRGLMMHNNFHKHKLFYQATGAKIVFQYRRCDICKKYGVISLETYYHCLECNCKIHFECLEIPRCVLEC
ncbi:unnamed protein product [Arabis nemorensis]|uniref:DC1 domain-containing protein n=1 Tax=Arabis nemorensis TaxID=586526 RepID=A0A565APJ8_9BRAS|nr:unnamed protein product [Arabis nemorensis]